MPKSVHPAKKRGAIRNSGVPPPGSVSFSVSHHDSQKYCLHSHSLPSTPDLCAVTCFWAAKGPPPIATPLPIRHVSADMYRQLLDTTSWISRKRFHEGERGFQCPWKVWKKRLQARLPQMSPRMPLPRWLAGEPLPPPEPESWTPQRAVLSLRARPGDQAATVPDASCRTALPQSRHLGDGVAGMKIQEPICDTCPGA